jgi:hypothetical protein
MTAFKDITSVLPSGLVLYIVATATFSVLEFQPLEFQSMPATSFLTPSQTLKLAGFGALLWLFAALLLRILGPMGVFEGSAHIMLYTLVVPGTYPFLKIAQKLVQLTPATTVVGVTVITASATLLDGIALAWFPRLYGAETMLQLASAAAILWGVGVGLVLGLWMGRA